MRVTLDLETNELIVPKNFFTTISKQNDLIAKVGGTKINPIELIKKSFETAMGDTDKYLVTYSPKVGKRDKKDDGSAAAANAVK